MTETFEDNVRGAEQTENINPLFNNIEQHIDVLNTVPDDIIVVRANTATYPDEINLLDTTTLGRYLTPIVDTKYGVFTPANITTMTISGLLLYVTGDPIFFMEEQLIKVVKTRADRDNNGEDAATPIVNIESTITSDADTDVDTDSDTDLHQNSVQKVDPNLPNYLIHRIHCNYGEVCDASYAEPELRSRSNRGRRKKEKIKKQRKPQGSGKDFNSQITYQVISYVCNHVYKPKIFRTGVIQLPGFQPSRMYDVIEVIEIIAKNLQKYIPLSKPGLKEIPIKLDRIITEMIDYRFMINTEDDEIIDFMALKSILRTYQQHDNGHGRMFHRIFTCSCARAAHQEVVTIECKLGDTAPKPLNDGSGCRYIDQEVFVRHADDNKPLPDIENDALIDIQDDVIVYDFEERVPDHPQIFLVTHTTNDNKLSVKFLTPISKDPKKKVRINFFNRGKVNILGAHADNVTRDIYNFLAYIVHKYRRYIVTKIGRDVLAWKYQLDVVDNNVDPYYLEKTRPVSVEDLEYLDNDENDSARVQTIIDAMYENRVSNHELQNIIDDKNFKNDVSQTK